MAGITVAVTASLLPGLAAGQATERAIDYFAARGSNRLAVVEQYHLGPCEQRFRERDFARAMSECNFILRVFPNHPNALLIVAQVCSQWKSGLCLLDETFERAIAINPKAAGTFVVQGIYQSRVKQYDAAVQSFRNALALDPEQVNAHYNLALTYLDMQKYDLANRHAQRAYQLGAALPGLRNRLQQSGHWDPSQTVAPVSEAAPDANAMTATAPPGKRNAQ